MFSPPMKPKKLRVERWTYVHASGIVSKIIYVVAMLGAQNNESYALTIDDTDFFLCTVRNALCVDLNQEFLTNSGTKKAKKRMFCTEEQFIIPGYWLKIILDLLPEAQAAENMQKDQQRRSEMQQLLSYLV